jgi:hypothetical protein
MYREELPFKVVRTNGHDEVLARAANPIVGPWGPMRRLSGCSDMIRYRNGAQSAICGLWKPPYRSLKNA